MGCDVHMFAEQKKNGKWEKIGKVFPNPHYNPEKESTTDEDGYEWNPKFKDSPYSGRNYDLFAILADVRNGRGFAGVKTGDGFNPISDPKGFPSDVSQEVKKLSVDYGDDGHSHSWFTLKELKDYDWSQETVIFGVVPAKEYINLKLSNQKPSSYCGSTSGSMVITLSQEDADKYVPKNYIGNEVHVQMKWTETYKEASGNFLDKIIEKLSVFGNDEDVRIVFFFDN